jgi:hypothetical protein
MKIKTINNFLNDKDFQDLKKFKFENIKPKEIKIFHNSIDRNGKILNELFSVDLIKKLQKNYHDKAIEILKETYPEKIKLYEYSEFHMIVAGSNYSFPIHDDTPNKLLSGVIYLNPKENQGTEFFDNKKGLNKKRVEWIQNTAIFFARKERETWHSYKSDGKSPRITLVYNLMTNDIKKVCKIEKKNFLYSLLRFKLNPYIYRYFKKVI